MLKALRQQFLSTSRLVAVVTVVTFFIGWIGTSDAGSVKCDFPPGHAAALQASWSVSEIYERSLSGQACEVAAAADRIQGIIQEASYSDIYSDASFLLRLIGQLNRLDERGTGYKQLGALVPLLETHNDVTGAMAVFGDAAVMLHDWGDREQARILIAKGFVMRHAPSETDKGPAQRLIAALLLAESAGQSDLTAEGCQMTVVLMKEFPGAGDARKINAARDVLGC